MTKPWRRDFADPRAPRGRIVEGVETLTRMRTSILLLKMLRAVLVGIALGLAVQALLTVMLGGDRQLPGASGAERRPRPPAQTLRS